MIHGDFISNLNKAIGILEPIEELITLFQSDKVLVSEVFNGLNNLSEKLTNLPFVTEGEKIYLASIVRHRWDFIYGDAHGIAYLLDPRYLGRNMETSLKILFEIL